MINITPLCTVGERIERFPECFIQIFCCSGEFFGFIHSDIEIIICCFLKLRMGNSYAFKQGGSEPLKMDLSTFKKKSLFNEVEDEENLRSHLEEMEKK